MREFFFFLLAPAIATIKHLLQMLPRCLSPLTSFVFFPSFLGVDWNTELTRSRVYPNSQFGNMLVLIATQRSWLSHLLDKREVVRLLDRTIRFLSSLAPISTTLAADADILKNLKFYYYTNEPQASSSFSSTG